MPRKEKTPDRIAKYEIVDYSLTAGERAVIASKNMCEALIIDLENIFENHYKRKERNLTDLVNDIRVALKDEDLVKLLHTERQRFRYHFSKAELRDRGNRAYWRARKRGVKELEAQDARMRVMDEPRQRRNKIYVGQSQQTKDKRRKMKGRKPKAYLRAPD